MKTPCAQFSQGAYGSAYITGVDTCRFCGQTRKAHEQYAAANARVTQAERAVLEAAKGWGNRPSTYHDLDLYGALDEALETLIESEKERDALNASTVGEERED